MVAMAAMCLTIIRYIRLLVHLVGTILMGGIEEGGGMIPVRQLRDWVKYSVLPTGVADLAYYESRSCVRVCCRMQCGPTCPIFLCVQINIYSDS
jgi:hypothetical protein